MATENKKQVKIHAKFRASESHCLWNASQGKEVPWLNLSGLWLEKLGFRIGDKVNITMQDNMLIIEPCKGGINRGDPSE